MARKRKLLRSEWPRVYWTPKRGRLRLVVDSRKTGFAAGRREFWDSEAEALASAELIAQQKDNEGASSFAELAPAQRRDAAEALALLSGCGTLLDAARTFVREIERARELAHVPTVHTALDAYLSAKRQEAARGDISRLTLYDLQSKARIIQAAFGNRKLTELDEPAIRKFLRELPHRTSSKRSIRVKLGQFLNYCRREGKWITANPAENISVKVKRRDVTILSIDEVRRLITAAVQSDFPQSVIPFLAVQLFAGLRPYEAARLRWEFIHFETGQLEVKSETSKTRETRFIPMESLLVETLIAIRKPRGSIIGTEFARTLHAVKEAAGFTFGADRNRPWPKDVLRHCYGSYWLAVHKDRAHLAELMGNSLAIIKAHYRRAIPETIAQEFWKLSLTIRKAGKIISIAA